MASHLKRLVAPKTWPIVRKTTKFVTRPKPTGQRMALTLPVVFVMRDMLGLVATAKQARTILHTKNVTLNGRRIYDADTGVGLMDLLVIEGKKYRIMLNKNNVLEAQQTTEDVILQKINGKTTVGKNKVQLNCSSGRNIIVAKDEYKVGDSIALVGGKVTASYPLAQGATVLLTGGNHAGKIGMIDKVEGQVISMTVGDEKIETAKRHAFVIGTGKPAITMQT